MSTGQLDKLAMLFRGLPTELQLMILHYVTLMEDTCAFQSFPGGWSVCRPNGKVEGRGTVSTSFDHVDEQLDHVFLALRTVEYDDIDNIQGVSEYELWKLHHRHNVIQLHVEPQHIRWRLDDANFSLIANSACLLRSKWAIENLPFSDTPAWAKMMQTSRDDGEPQVFSLVRHLMFHTEERYSDLSSTDFYYPAYYWNHEALTNSILVRRRLAHEHCHGLFLRWDMMPQLESLFVDLRAYSWGAVGRHILKRAAREMSDSPALRLRLLVLVGLRSGPLYPDPDELDIEQVEDYDPEKDFDPGLGEKHPEPNWFRLFRGALRPGGELVLIDSEGKVRKRRASLVIEFSPGHRAVFRSDRPHPWAPHDVQWFPPAMGLADVQKWSSRTRDTLFTEEATAFPPQAAPANMLHDPDYEGDGEDITMAFSPW